MHHLWNWLFPVGFCGTELFVQISLWPFTFTSLPLPSARLGFISALTLQEYSYVISLLTCQVFFIGL